MCERISLNLYKMNEEIVCEKCGSSVNKLNYNHHLKTHKEKKVETCNICFKAFTNLSNFKYHMSHHSEDRNWHCDECPKSYKTKVDLIQHKRVHDKAKEPYNCEICHQMFNIKSKYNSHLRIHSVKGNQICEFCSKSFVNLRSHIQQVHLKIRNFKCSLCSKVFGKKSGLLRHTLIVHEKLKTWLCDICEKSFGEKSQLIKHLSTHSKQKKARGKFLGDKNDAKVLPQNAYIDDSQSKINSINASESTYEIDENYRVNLEIEKLDQVEETIEVLDEFRDSVYAEIPTNEFKCHLCSITFKQKRYYQSHLQTVHNQNGEKSLTCKYCSEKFNHRTQRLRHVRQRHSEIYEENDQYGTIENDEEISSRTCNLCNKIFKKSKYLEIHSASVHSIQLFQCDLCQREFSFKRSLERHIRAIHQNIRDYRCIEKGCDKAFRSRYESKMHFKNIHSNIKKNELIESVTCDICQKVCSSKKVLYSHKKFVHEGIRWGNNYECKMCFEKFDTKYKKIKHVSQVHRNGNIKVRTCHLCSKDFQFYEDFKKHIESHKDCFICIICGHNFSDDSALFIHLESHKKIEEEYRQFICDICSHRLSTKSQLQIHMRKHSCENYYICDKCGKTYKFLAPFLHHKLVHKNIFDYNCSHCSKVFRKRRELIMHEKVHSGERPYKCNICEKTFVLKPNYSNHMKTHQAKIFECKICHVYQNSSSKLRLHEISEHPEEYPYKCINCPNAFKTQHTFEHHKVKCTDENEF